MGRSLRSFEDGRFADGLLLQIQLVVVATGLSVTTIYRKVAAGELAIVKMGKRCTRFRAADVRAFIHAQGVAA